MDTPSIFQIILILLALVVVWSILKAILQLTWKIFSFGCSMIVLLAIVWGVWQIVGNR